MRATFISLTWTAAALCVSACVEPIEVGLDAGSPTGSTFTSDPRPAGAALWLEADLTSQRDAVVRLKASGLGGVFGLACHLRFDDQHLSAVESTMAEPLGSDGLYLNAARVGDVALGGARPGRAAGEVTIDGDTLVATAYLHALREGTSRLDVRSAQVRRADGSFIEARVAGGTLTIAEEAR